MNTKLFVAIVAVGVGLCLAPIYARADYQRNFGHLANYGQSQTTVSRITLPGQRRSSYRPRTRRYHRPAYTPRYRYGHRHYRPCAYGYYRPVARTVSVFDPWYGWRTIVVYY